MNIVLGEKDDSSSRNNGVGKSLCIEFLNFALLKKKSESRVARIPADVLARTTFICADFENRTRNVHAHPAVRRLSALIREVGWHRDC
ncbi:hypothetical protein PMI09_04865 [Rhizobium sp. CF122]|nr:hypothetical protein PMI09_04865 [Rhizobium sp. CF122]